MTDIEISNITNATDTGIFDILMNAVGKKIESQYLNNRITGGDYANVYLGSIQAVLQQSMQYVLQEQLIEAQVDGALADNLLKEEQLKGAYTDRVLKDKQVAKLGLDSVMKTSEALKSTDTSYVYTPNYTEG